MIKAALDAYVASSGRQWQTDRSQTVGASEIGMCARRVAFSKTLDDPGSRVELDEDFEDSWGAARRGNLIEDHLFVPAIRARFGAAALFTGDEQRTFTSGFLSATPDGLLIEQPSDALAHLGVTDIEGDAIDLDCKSIDPRTRLTGPKPENVFQVQVQIGLIRETTNFRPGYAVISYIDASFLDRVTEFAVRFDPSVYEVAKERARQIMTAAHGKDLRPEGIMAGGADCRWCPFTRQCGTVRAARVPKDVVDLPADVASLVTQQAALAQGKAADVEMLEAEIAQHKEKIRDALEEAGSKGLPGVASWSSIKGRLSWDDKGIRQAAEAAGVDLSSYKKIGDPSDRLTLHGSSTHG